MTSLSRVLVLSGLVLAVVVAAGHAQPDPRLDAFGDPLPDNAIARLGTARCRSETFVIAAASSPDGKRLAVSRRDSDRPRILILDTVSGKEQRRLDFGPGALEADLLSFSPDGRFLAAAHQSGPDGIQLFKVDSGELAQTFKSHVRDLRDLRFSQDGKVLVSADGDSRHGSAFVAWDTATGKELGRLSAANHDEPFGVVVSPDGKLAASWGLGVGLVLWDTATGKEARRLKPNDGVLCAAFSPDGQSVAVGEHAAVSVWDVGTGRLVRRSAARRGAEPLVAFSADGKTLAAADDEAVQLWEAATGKRLGLYPGLPSCPRALTFAEGKLLASGLSWQAAWVWDVKAGKPLTTTGGHQSPVQSMAFLPDGKELITSASDGALVWDVGTGKQVRRVEVKKPQEPRLQRYYSHFRRWSLCPDGKRMLVSLDGAGLSVVDAATGEVEFHIGAPGVDDARLGQVVVSADGTTLAATREYQAARLIQAWDLRTGEELPSLNLPQVDGRCVALSADGKTLAVGSTTWGAVPASTVELWDTASGKQLRTIKPAEGTVNRVLAFSPDGALVAAFCSGTRNRDAVVAWDAATGQEYLRLPCDPAVASNLAFALDGRTLALVCGPPSAQPHRLIVWELASGTVRREFRVRGESNVLAISPDSRTLAQGAADTTVTLWDVGGQLVPRASEKPTAKQLDDLWAALDELEAKQAHGAMLRLAASPGEAVELLKGRLRPASPADEKVVAGLIADLDSEDFPTRDAAAKELMKLGLAAKPAMQKALAAKPSPEQRRRLDDLLEKLTQPGPARAMLRPTRALEVLERLGTPEARALLKELAGGHAGAPLTRQARESLKRLTPAP